MPNYARYYDLECYLFQEVAQRNHLGFWTERVACQTSTCGAEEVCVDGQCTPIIQ